MKKLMMAIVCLMTTVVLVSCGNIEEDGNKAIEKFEKWEKECIESHTKANAEKAISFIRDNVKKHKKRTNAETHEMFEGFYKEIENDANTIVSKCFDPLFDKYSEKKVVEWVNNKANENFYDPIKLNSKDELYEHFKSVILLNYQKRFNQKFELESCNLKLELLKERY